MQDPRLKIKEITARQELESAFAIRHTVFIIGQQVDPAIEMDEFDTTATHILATIGDTPVGTARWRSTPQGTKLERFAVLDEYRGRGVGRALVEAVLERIDLRQPAYLNGQLAVMPFYEKLGFVAEGDVFYEANIPHRRMVLTQKESD